VNNEVNLAILVQGYFRQEDIDYLRTLRLSKVRIYISCWADQQHLLECESNLIVISNIDPGTVTSSSGKQYNLNRQITHWQSALSRIREDVILKIRPDIRIRNFSALVDLVNKHISSHPDFVGVTNVTTLLTRPGIAVETLHLDHFCDWIVFGTHKTLSSSVRKECINEKNVLCFEQISYAGLFSITRYPAVEQALWDRHALQNKFFKVYPLTLLGLDSDKYDVLSWRRYYSRYNYYCPNTIQCYIFNTIPWAYRYYFPLRRRLVSYIYYLTSKLFRLDYRNVEL